MLLAEERQARRVLRREAKWNEEQRDGQREDYEEEYMEQQQQQAQLEATLLEQQRTLPQDKRSSATIATTADSVDSADSMDRLNPALASSPLRKGGERLPSRGRHHGGGRSRGGSGSGSGSRRQGRQRRQGSSRGLQQESGLNGSLRPVLAWHEKARLLMQRWEREMAVSAWPTDASTGRMSPTRRSTARGRR